MSTLESHIHPTAVIDPKAKIAEGVKIGPYSVIGPDVELKEGVSISSHCHLEGHTTIGERTEIFPGAVIGTEPQDKKHNDGDEVTLEIGKENTIREYVMINPGTIEGGGKTVIGDKNLLMAYCHVAHDCMIGNRCILANAANVAGHVVIEDGAIVGGLTGVHQFVRIGRLAMVGGCSRVGQDVVPFALCSDADTKVYGVNLIGLRRAGFSAGQIDNLKRAFKLLFFSGLNKTTAIDQIVSEIDQDEAVQHFVNFVREGKRGLMGAR